MIRFTLLLLILFSLLAGSCSRRKNKLDSRGLIPEKELVSILTDLYITDGLLSLPKVRHWFPSVDSTSSYFNIIEKHGYSKESMDKTMKYYFIKKPKKLIQFYDQVLGILSVMESRFDKEATVFQVHTNNLWKGREFYCLPDPKGDNSTIFNIPLNRPGTYTITFSATLFPNDQSVNPRITVYSCHPDSVDTGKRRYVETIGYIKDGKPHTYTLIIKVPEKTILHLRGRLFDFDNNPGQSEEHVIFENISLTYTHVVA